MKNLVLPAADEAESLWINKFGFSKSPPEEVHSSLQYTHHMLGKEIRWIKMFYMITGDGVQETLPDDDLPRDVGTAEGDTAISGN